MTRVPITDEVVAQLREVIESGRVEDPIGRHDVQAVAFDRGLDRLSEFIASADAATYYEAVVQARESAEGDVRDPERGASE